MYPDPLNEGALKDGCIVHIASCRSQLVFYRSKNAYHVFRKESWCRM